MSAVIENLKAAREIIKEQRNWTVAALARDAAGKGLMSALDPAATSFCIAGALLNVSHMENWPYHNDQVPGWKELDRYCERVHGTSPIYVNNQMGHAVILEALDATIEELEKKI